VPTGKTKASAHATTASSPAPDLAAPTPVQADPTLAADEAGRPTATQQQAAPTTLDRVTGVATAPVAAADRILPAMGGLPLYLGLAGLAAVGVLEWPVAAAAGLGYAGYAVLHRGRGPAASA
jgi:hypothetical protein